MMGEELERIRKRLYKLDGKRSGLISLRKSHRKLAREASKRSTAASGDHVMKMKIKKLWKDLPELRLALFFLCAPFFAVFFWALTVWDRGIREANAEAKFFLCDIYETICSQIKAKYTDPNK